MTLEFNEAPDYAALFEKEFDRQNRAWDDYEEAQQANDERRIEAAKQPLEVLEGLLEFSEKAAPIVQGIREGKQQRQLDEFNTKNYSAEQRELNYAVYSEGKKVLFQDLQVNQRYAEKLKAEGRDIDANLLIEKSEWNRTKFGFQRARIDASKDNLIKDFEEAHPNWKSYEPATARSEIDKFLTDRRQQFNKMPTVLYNDIRSHFDQFKNTLISEKHQSVEQVRKSEKTLRDQGEVYYALTQTDPIARKERLLDFVETNFIPQGGKRKDGWNYAIGHTIKLLETGQITPAQAHQIKDILIEHRGEQGKEKDVGSMYYQIFEANNFDGAVAKAAKKYNDNLKLEKQQASDSKRQELLQREKERGSGLTQSEINYELRNWDETTMGPIPEWLNDWSSSFDAQPMNAPDRPSYGIQTQANALITGYASVRVTDNPELTEVNKEIITQRAGSLYQQYFAEEMLDADSEQSAHLDALKRVQDDINAGRLDEMPPVNRDKEKEHKLNLDIASKAVASEPNIINTGIIFGSESALEEVRADPSRVHPFYKQLARQLKVEPHVLQFNQLAIANKLFGKDEPIKSDIVKEFEQLDPNVQELLSGHTTPGRVQRALIEQYGIDKDISYDDVGFLIDERLAQIPVEETVFDAPKEIKKSPRSRRKGNQKVNTELQQSIKKWFNIFSTSAAEAGSYRTDVEEPEWVTELKQRGLEQASKSPRSRLKRRQN